MNKIAKLLTVILCIGLSSIFYSCEEEVMDGGKWTYEPGGVLMDIDGEFQKIDDVAYEIPADSDYITLTVYFKDTAMHEYNINIVSSNNMEVELLDPPTESTKPCRRIGYGLDAFDIFRHHIRITAAGDSEADRNIQFNVTYGIWYVWYVSNFTVTKKATKQ